MFIIYSTEKISHNYLHYVSWYGTNNNPPWLELPLSRTNFHSPKGVRAIEVRMYLEKLYLQSTINSHSINIYERCPSEQMWTVKAKIRLRMRAV